MDPQKIQHEFTPEMEQKILRLAKKGIKWYLIFIIAIVGIAIIGGILFYRKFFSPTYKRALDAQQNILQQILQQQKNINLP